jgi:hypothetical protein
LCDVAIQKPAKQLFKQPRLDAVGYRSVPDSNLQLTALTVVAFSAYFLDKQDSKD